jgi:hypothetical protein
MAAAPAVDPALELWYNWHQGDDKAMGKVASFAEVLEAAGELPLDDQETLAEILHRRVIERRREELAREVVQAQKEYKQGRCRPVTPDELMAEILA